MRGWGKRCGASCAFRLAGMRGGLGTRRSGSPRCISKCERQACGGAAKAAGDVEQVAGPRAGAEQGLAAPNRAGSTMSATGMGDSARSPPARGVWWASARARNPSRKRAIQVASREGSRRLSFGRDRGAGQGKKGSDGPRAHSSQVAEAARESAMADGLGRVPVEAEVAAGDGEVGGDGQLLAGSKVEQGAVVADAQAQRGTRRSGRAGANPGEQRQLARFAGTRRFHAIRPHLLSIGHGAANVPARQKLR